jgi:hypothetical protein
MREERKQKMETAIETVEPLEAQHRALSKRIASLVDAETNADLVVRLLLEKSALSERIEAAKAERIEQERRDKRREREQAQIEFPEALAECRTQREAFLTHRREACIALGKYLRATDKAYSLSNKLATTLGPALEYENAVRALGLGDDLQKSLSDLKPDMGAGWKLNYSISPMYEKFNTKE